MRLAAGERLLAARRGDFVVRAVHLHFASLGTLGPDRRHVGQTTTGAGLPPRRRDPSSFPCPPAGRPRGSRPGRPASSRCLSVSARDRPFRPKLAAARTRPVPVFPFRTSVGSLRIGFWTFSSACLALGCGCFTSGIAAKRTPGPTPLGRLASAVLISLAGFGCWSLGLRIKHADAAAALAKERVTTHRSRFMGMRRRRAGDQRRNRRRRRRWRRHEQAAELDHRCLGRDHGRRSFLWLCDRGGGAGGAGAMETGGAPAACESGRCAAAGRRQRGGGRNRRRKNRLGINEQRRGGSAAAWWTKRPSRSSAWRPRRLPSWPAQSLSGDACLIAELHQLLAVDLQIFCERVNPNGHVRPPMSRRLLVAAQSREPAYFMVAISCTSSPRQPTGADTTAPLPGNSDSGTRCWRSRLGCDPCRPSTPAPQPQNRRDHRAGLRSSNLATRRSPRSQSASAGNNAAAPRPAGPASGRGPQGRPVRVPRRE